MLRLFVALDLPEPIRTGIADMGRGIPGARPVPVEQLHITLKFLGEVAPHRLDDITAALAEIRHPAFLLRLQGVGHFPPRGLPTVLWVGVHASEGLQLLQRRIDNILYHRGFPRESRNFAPHVTVARLRDTSPAKVATFLATNNLLASPEFTADRFTLYSSSLTPKGAIHTVRGQYQLL